MKMIAKGAEGEIFELRGNGRNEILKRRVVKRYRIPSLDKKIREARTKREAKVLFAAKMSAIRCPLIYDVNLRETEILMERLEGMRLREYLEEGNGNASKILAKTGANLARLHNADIIHGDFSTANVMVMRKGEIAIIDFGLSDFSSSIEDKATDVLVFKKSTNGEEFNAFRGGYEKEAANSKAIFRQLMEIEKRGRYVSRAQAL